MQTVELTFEQIQKWSGDEMKEAMKNPSTRAAIEKLLTEKAEELNSRLAAKEAEEIATGQAEYEAQQQKEAERAELERQAKLTPEEREAEQLAIEKQEADRLAAEAVKIAEEKAAEERATAEKAEAERLAAEKAEAERKDLEEKARLAEEAAKPKKIIREYQVRDDNGNPIGRPTHLEADSWEEMSKKQEEAHIQAVKWANRLKLKKENAEKYKPASDIPTLTDEDIAAAIQDLDDKDPNKKAAAIRKITNADAVAEAAKKAELARVAADAERQSLIFLQHHLERQDYFNCEANAKQLEKYIRDNGLAWTVDNLELAFEELGSKLAQQPREVVQLDEPVAPRQEIPPAPPANPAPVQAPAVAPVQETVAPVPAVPPAPVVNPPAPERKLPAAGIEPGSLHGSRPQGTRPAGLTKQDIARMPRDEYKKRMKDPSFVKRVNDLFARK